MADTPTDVLRIRRGASSTTRQRETRRPVGARAPTRRHARRRAEHRGILGRGEDLPLACIGAHLPGRVLLAILTAQTCGGLASIFTKLALDGGLEPWTMVLLRQLLGTALLFGIARARGTVAGAAGTPLTPREWGLVVLAGFGGFALPQILLAVGIDRSTGTMGALLVPLEPLAIVLGSVLFLSERLSTGRIVAIAFGLAGALLVLGQGRLDVRFGDPVGDVLIALGHASWAIATLATKPLLARHDPGRISLLVVAASLGPVALLALTEPFDLQAALPGLVWVVVLAVLATGVGTWTWNYGLRQTSASTMASFVFIQPVVGLAAGVLFLHEAVGAVQLAGAALIAGGVAVEARSSRRRRAADARGKKPQGSAPG